MDLFEIKNIDGTDRALFHLDERAKALHAKEGYFEKYTAFPLELVPVDKVFAGKYWHN